MRDLIRYAAVRNVEIIPELDLPGHSRNFARVHPEILCDYTPDLRPTAGYDYRSVWCASREENYRLLADILGELAALFPSEYLHIGGDEVDMSQGRSVRTVGYSWRAREWPTDMRWNSTFWEG